MHFLTPISSKFRLVLISLLLVSGISVQAQAYRDQVKAMNERHIMCDTVPQLADSVFQALKLPRFDSLEVYTPSYPQIKATYDTMDLNQNDQFVLIKQQYLVHNLHKQFKELQIQAKRNKINLKYMELTDKTIRYGVHKDGHQFAQVTLKCMRNNKKFEIRFIAIKVLEHWYIGDELKLYPVVREKSIQPIR